MKKLIPATACAVIMICWGLSYATAPPADSTQMSSTAAESKLLTKNLIFHGTIEKIEEGTALSTEKGIYPLLGGDFDMIVGKKVNIIGKMIKEGSTEKIAVSRVQFDRE